MSTNRPTFSLTIAVTETGAPIMFDAVTEWYDTKEQAEAIVAGLPKSVRARVRECSFTLTGSGLKKDYVTRYAAGAWAQLRSTKNNEKNETGLKRLDALMKNANVNYTPKYANSPATLDLALASL